MAHPQVAVADARAAHDELFGPGSTGSTRDPRAHEREASKDQRGSYGVNPTVRDDSVGLWKGERRYWLNGHVPRKRPRSQASTQGCGRRVSTRLSSSGSRGSVIRSAMDTQTWLEPDPRFRRAFHSRALSGLQSEPDSSQNVCLVHKSPSPSLGYVDNIRCRRGCAGGGHVGTNLGAERNVHPPPIASK